MHRLRNCCVSFSVGPRLSLVPTWSSSAGITCCVFREHEPQQQQPPGRLDSLYYCNKVPTPEYTAVTRNTTNYINSCEEYSRVLAPSTKHQTTHETRNKCRTRRNRHVYHCILHRQLQRSNGTCMGAHLSTVIQTLRPSPMCVHGGLPARLSRTRWHFVPALQSCV